MKSVLYIYVLLILLSSCIDKEQVEVCTIDLELSFEKGIDSSIADGEYIEITNAQNSRVFKAEVKDSKARISLEKGIYNVSFSLVKENIPYNGYLNKIDLFNPSTEPYILLVMDGLISPLVIKELYYSGSETPAGRPYLSDQFIEIYNNSDIEQSIAGLCIASVSTVLKGNLEASYPVNQMLWRIPDNAKRTILLPGESVVIAQDAINHADPLLSNSTVNLENADFETYCTKGDLDNPEVDNMQLIWPASANFSDWIITPRGVSYILFSLPDDYKAFIEDERNYKSLPGKTKIYIWIPKDFVLDGVECIYDENKYVKNLHKDIDESYTFVSKIFKGYSLRRKVIDVVNGRALYMDTNNSKVDFLRDQLPSPAVNPIIIDEE
jgi:hypothetical protein